MNNSPSFYIQITITVILSFFIISSKADNSERENLAFILHEAFDGLAVVRDDLSSFPSNEDHLQQCIQYNLIRCMDNYRSVQAAVDSISSLPTDEALDVTLEIIGRACVAEDGISLHYFCNGGIMSLYFYTTPEQDAEILAHVKQYPKQIQNFIFNDHFYWFHNRPDKEVWIDYISAADIDFKHKNQKKTISNLFRKRIDEMHKKFGDTVFTPWVLLAKKAHY